VALLGAGLEPRSWQGHHPEWFNVYDTLRVHLSTRDAGGISTRDFQLAAAMNAHFA
jgi:4a-hydroxytetrahydrobiopterin dehydratase